MCGSCGSSSHPIYLPANKHCCPDAKVFVEELCGNLNGPLTNFAVWTAPTPNDYFQATFTITNTGASELTVSINGVSVAVPARTTLVRSVNNPTTFNATLDATDSATYCIKLYKRAFV